jgi:hypothetical protein
MKSKKEVEILSNQCTEVTNEVGTTTAFEYEGGNISNLFQQRKAVKTRHMFANSVGGGGAGGNTTYNPTKAAGKCFNKLRDKEINRRTEKERNCLKETASEATRHRAQKFWLSPTVTDVFTYIFVSYLFYDATSPAVPI